MDNCYASDRSTHPGWNPQLLAVSGLMLCVEHAHFLIPDLAPRSIEMTDSRTPCPLLVTPNYQQHAAARESNDIATQSCPCLQSVKSGGGLTQNARFGAPKSQNVRSSSRFA